MPRKDTVRMPVAEQRRLNALIDKNKGGRLTTSEQRELRSLLEDVDRQSFWMLARKLVLGRAVPAKPAFATPRTSKRAAVS